MNPKRDRYEKQVRLRRALARVVDILRRGIFDKDALPNARTLVLAQGVETLLAAARAAWRPGGSLLLSPEQFTLPALALAELTAVQRRKDSERHSRHRRRQEEARDPG